MSVSKKAIESVDLQPRDLALLRGLFESRVMTAGHVATLYFDGKREYTKKRLQKLKAAGYIGERQRRVNESSILFLTRKAFTLLKTGGHLAEYPPLGLNSFASRSDVSELTLRHELDIMDVKTAIHTAVTATPQLSVAEFGTWPLLYQFEVAKSGHSISTPVKPDGFIRIHEKEPDGGLSEHTFFLEVDRSSETQDALVNKAVSYLEYHRSGGFAVRNGATPAEARDFPFRVLMVMKSIERRNNTAERLAHNTPSILTLVMLTTQAEVTANPFGPIWIQPADYREVTKGTIHYNEHPERKAIYRRQTERDHFIESKIKKHRLLDD